MEIREREWNKAATAAEKGLKLLPDNRKLLYLSGYARSRLAKELLGGRHEGKANKELTEARMSLERALSLPHDKDVKEINLGADIYRALVIVCEVSSDMKSMRHYLKLWQSKHPDDPDAVSEWERISQKYGTTSP